MSWWFLTVPPWNHPPVPSRNRGGDGANRGIFFEMSTNLELALAYLDKLPVAQSGAGGHNATLQAALACRRFSLEPGEMWQAMNWFNDNRCNPKWSERELRHKVASVADLPIKKPLGQRGQAGRASRTFVPPAPVEAKAETRPVYQQSAQAEELWWAQRAHELGMSLEDFDGAVGNA